MALYVNTNASSLNAQRMMANSTNSLDTSYKRLASGYLVCGTFACNESVSANLQFIIRQSFSIIDLGAAG